MTRLTTQEMEQIANLTTSITQNLEEGGILRVTDKELIIYKSINEKDPQNLFITLIKTNADLYGIPYEETERVFKMSHKDFTDFYICNKLSN